MCIIRFKEVNCKSCYKCIRSCPVKAISFDDDHAQVISEECILCGKCLQVCPQHAKRVNNEIDKVKSFINKKFKVYASVAPSFAAAFNIKDEKHMYSIFKKLGFTYAEETAIGAVKVSEEYQKLLEKKEMQNIITTACPTIVNLIEKQYPKLIDQLAPVVSPIIAHGKMLKETYGSRIKIIFVGPCLSKKDECMDTQFGKVIDAVITFEEFEKWLRDEEISLEDEENEENEEEIDLHHNLISRYYPAPGGIIKTLGPTKKYEYKFAKFDGIDRCIKILEEIQNSNLNNYFIEMNSCEGGCLGGPCMNSDNPGFLEMRSRLTSYINKSSSKIKTNINYESRAEFTREFNDKSKINTDQYETKIVEILRKIGKFSKEDELNCGACGYNSCREKAIAVLNKKANLRMCLPYMRERAESISNVIINSTPNAIIALTEDFHITEVNLAAQKMFNIDTSEIHNINIFDILDCADICVVNETKKNIYNNKYYYNNYNVVVEQSILYLKENGMILVIMKDITKEENKKLQMYKVRCETVDIAQKVIEKQMRVAQEIASLLGETTADTKIALTKLKNSIQSEIGEDA